MGSECSPEKRPEEAAAPVVPAAAGAKADAKDAKATPAPAAPAAAPITAPGATASAGGSGDEATATAIRAAEAKMEKDRKGLEDSFPSTYLTAEAWRKATEQYAKLYADFKAQYGASTHAEAVRVRAAADALTARAAEHLKLLHLKEEMIELQHGLSGGGGSADVMSDLVFANGAAKKLLKTPAPERDPQAVEAKVEALSKALAAWVAARPDWSRFEALKTMPGADDQRAGLEQFPKLEADAKLYLEQLKKNA